MTFLTQTTLKKLFCQVVFCWGIITFFSASASANIVVLSTRIIYPEKNREVTIRLENRGERPSLVQTWVDKGDASAAVSTLEVPFILMPPVSRIDAHKGQTLRLAYTGKALPKDKESVFWLNVLDIPPKSETTEVSANILQMAVRSRLKIFFRPEGLSHQAALDAAKNVKWTVVSQATGYQLTATNHSPFFVNISSVTININGQPVSLREGEMIAPGEKHAFFIKSASRSKIPDSVSYTVINDFGGATEYIGLF